MAGLGKYCMGGYGRIGVYVGTRAKSSHWGSIPTRAANANPCVFFWNMGFQLDVKTHRVHLILIRRGQLARYTPLNMYKVRTCSPPWKSPAVNKSQANTVCRSQPLLAYQCVIYETPRVGKVHNLPGEWRHFRGRGQAPRPPKK